MKCTNCGREADPGAKFCRGCGSPIPEEVVYNDQDSYDYDEPTVGYGYGGGSYDEPQYDEPEYEQPQYEQPRYEQPGYEQPKREQSNAYGAPQSQPSAQEENVTPNKKNFQYAGFSYKPISAWGYFGWSILFSIPVVGLILLIVFSVGGTKNINLRNFARSHWCSIILGIIITAAAFIWMIMYFGSINYAMWYLFGIYM